MQRLCGFQVGELLSFCLLLSLKWNLIHRDNRILTKSNHGDQSRQKEQLKIITRGSILQMSQHSSVKKRVLQRLYINKMPFISPFLQRQTILNPEYNGHSALQGFFKILQKSLVCFKTIVIVVSVGWGYIIDKVNIQHIVAKINNVKFTGHFQLVSCVFSC